MLPPDFEGADALKVGDVLKFKVVAKNDDGTTELDEVGKPAGGAQKPMMQDFNESVTGNVPPEQQ